MYKNRTVLCLIPARGGSKGVPKKNIKNLYGKPLIAWSIQHARSSSYIDRIIISTDDREIADVAQAYGGEVPFLRPKYLSTDNAATMDVVLHAIKYIEKKNIYDILVLLEPTSPLREASDIDQAIEHLIDSKKAESIVGVGKVENVHPSFLVKLYNNYLRSYINKNFKVIRRQEIETLYFFEGSLYIAYIACLKNRKSFYHEKSLGYVMPKWKTFEVDDQIDFIIIEALMKAKAEGYLDKE